MFGVPGDISQIPCEQLAVINHLGFESLQLFEELVTVQVSDLGNLAVELIEVWLV